MTWIITITLLLPLATVWTQLTNVHVSSGAKEAIIETASSDIDAAFELYTKSYPDSAGTGFVLAAGSLEGLKKARKKQKDTFTKNVKKMEAHNKKYKRGEASYSLTVNSFTVIDTEDRKRYLGVASPDTAGTQKYLSAPKLTSGKLQARPTSFDWRKKGYVTEVKNQGSCGSCWTYGAVGPMEYIYKNVTGKLLQLSEQELLDCTYESTGENGCDGGWYHQAWDFVIGRGGRSAETSDSSHIANQDNYNYVGKDGSCSHAKHSNALKDIFKITGYVHVTKGDENAVLNAVAFKMPLAVAFTVEDDFYTIKDGIYDGCPSVTNPNHAVVMTGYGQDYFEIKNSWGKDWANGGYARLRRHRNTCGILNWAYYIEFQQLSERKESDDSGEITTAPPDDYFTTEAQQADDRPDVDTSTCFDYEDECKVWAEMGYCSTYYDYMKAMCKISCSDCTCKDNEDDECSQLKQSGYCSNAMYKDYMNQNCPVTCGHCKPCPAGYYTAPAGCTKCPKGTYSSAGSALCSKCPSGSTSQPGSTSRAACKKTGCGAGYYRYNGMCLACPENSYSTEGDVECTSCPDGTTTGGVAATSSADCKAVYKCEDNEADCLSWANYGYCIDTSSNMHYDYVALNCKKSCGFCGDCYDRDTSCESYKSMGYCKTGNIYYTYMATKCMKTCGFCGGSSDDSSSDDSSDSGNDDSSDSGNDDSSDENKCGGGLTWCNGACKHIHMCKY